jgi:hypothetical protein
LRHTSISYLLRRTMPETFASINTNRHFSCGVFVVTQIVTASRLPYQLP